MRQNFTITGSGSEDIGGMRMSQEHVSRQENNAHRRAEDVHRMRRMDRDRLVATALHQLVISAGMKQHASSDDRSAATWMFRAANLHGASDTLMTTDEMESYVRALLDEIRASLSPVVTGKTTV